MKKIINISLAIILSINIVFIVVSMTLLNKHFILHTMEKNNYYLKVKNKVDSYYDKDISIKKIKKDFKNYVSSRYQVSKINSQDEVYISYITFDNFLGRTDLVKTSYTIYAITLIMILLVGTIFIKTKMIHNLNKIFIYSFILLTSIFGVLKLNIYFHNSILNTIFKTFNSYILGVGIILLEIALFRIYKAKKDM